MYIQFFRAVLETKYTVYQLENCWEPITHDTVSELQMRAN